MKEDELIKNICLSWPLKILVTDLFQFRQSLHKGFPGDYLRTGNMCSVGVQFKPLR